MFIAGILVCIRKPKDDIALGLYVALLLNLAAISTEFSGAITTQFSFTYRPEGVTAMPRGLYAGLCHAFIDLKSLSVVMI